ncbi:hypothetical protein CQW23_25448 [Capsicum baccatum]|uniref:Uncharacterized protein n=1 Tax=Capsicum baccatum TaxID=33114 RepID=A0A2G2VL05_CAPBA|nr:hypothetical protein CQW23_25448 [Capsicum baccatum]
MNFILSHFKDKKVKVLNIYSQSSSAGGESSTLVEEKVGENVLVAPLATERKVKDTIKEISNNSETKVTTDDQVVQKPSLTSNEKEKSFAETTPIVRNEAHKLSYASMMKQGRSSPPANTPYKNVRVVTEDGLLSTPKRPEASSLVQALTSSPSGVSKAATASTNVAQDRCKFPFAESNS